MKNAQVSDTRTNRTTRRLVRRFAYAAAMSVGLLGVSNIQAASAAPDASNSLTTVLAPQQATTPCASMFAPCGLLANNTSNNAALFNSQLSDMQQAQTLYAQVSAQQSAQASQNWQITQANQTSSFAYAQGVTYGAALRANSSMNLMAGYVR